jgi:hypothetical protein
MPVGQHARIFMASPFRAITTNGLLGLVFLDGLRDSFHAANFTRAREGG